MRFRWCSGREKIRWTVQRNLPNCQHHLDPEPSACKSDCTFTRMCSQRAGTPICRSALSHGKAIPWLWWGNFQSLAERRMRVNRGVVGLALAIVCTSCSSAVGTGSRNEPSVATAAPSTTALLSPATDESRRPCALSEIDVAVAFVRAVQQGDANGYSACEVLEGGPGSDRLDLIRDWGPLRFEAAHVTPGYANEVSIPSRDVPNIAEGSGTTFVLAPHQNGIAVTLQADSTGDYFVTDASAYSSD